MYKRREPVLTRAALIPALFAGLHAAFVSFCLSYYYGKEINKLKQEYAHLLETCGRKGNSSFNPVKEVQKCSLAQ